VVRPQLGRAAYSALRIAPDSKIDAIAADRGQKAEKADTYR